MATAKLHDGRAIVAYVKGKAVDSEGVVIEGAPKEPKDTDPSLQPGALGAPTPEERMGLAIAKAIVNPKATVAAAEPRAAKAADGKSAKTDETGAEEEGEQEIPKISDLADHLAGLKTAKEVKALQKRDERVGAQKLYEARLDELKSE